MSFRIAARTILQLGAELISSDGVAFYELVKNAFDANSKKVEIKFTWRIDFDAAEEISTALSNISEGKDDDTLDKIRDRFLAYIIPTAPSAGELREQVMAASTNLELQYLLAESNVLEIIDWGDGMSLQDLESIYLTIGTPVRLKERMLQTSSKNERTSNVRPILGEKGIGRLSVMRLGQQLKVVTTKKGELNWNILEINWRLFAKDPDEMVDSVRIVPLLGDLKQNSEDKGTRIRISALNASWSKEKLAKIASEEFCKLTDPFIPSSRYPITLRYNKEVIAVPSFDNIVLKYAHAVVTAEFKTPDERGITLSGKVDYLLRKREKSFKLDEHSLVSVTEALPIYLRRLGSFSIEFYWFNRQLLRKSKEIPERNRVVDLQAQWGGGLMVYRDGFRVNPYGSKLDDWLHLDPDAFGAGGYKVNRSQIIGKVEISSEGNPYLVDQTNREGLRDNQEFRCLVALLQHVLSNVFRPFLDEVDKEVNARESVNLPDVEERLDKKDLQLKQSVELLIKQPEVAKDSRFVAELRDTTSAIREIIKDVTQQAKELEKGKTQLVHLAGLGLMVEFLAHELNRATQHTLNTLNNAEKKGLPPDVESLFATLRVQLKTLGKRLSNLDKLSTAGRQVKEHFDLFILVQDILKSHDAQFVRHGIKIECKLDPPSAQPSLRVKAVPGMIVQIVENLISNSVYWLKVRRKLDDHYTPKINIVIDAIAKQIRFTDNGPGVKSERREEIFQAFVTTKPPGLGKGLGLYIAREVAEYNEASLYLSDEHRSKSDMLNTFVFNWEIKR